jgi:outer membrane protein OmpA-like peptidoglycan-associated protein
MSRDWREPFFVVFVVLIVVVGLLAWVRRPSQEATGATFSTEPVIDGAVPTAVMLPTPRPTPARELIPSRVSLAYAPEAITLVGEVPSQPLADAMVAASALLVGRSSVTVDLELVNASSYTGTVLTIEGEVIDDVERARVIAAFSGIGLSIEDRLVPAGTDRTVLELIETTAELSDMFDFLGASGVGSDLDSPEVSYTVFAVTNDALTGLDAATLTVLSSDFEVLAEVLRFHFVEGTYALEDLAALETVTTVDGGTLAIGRSGDDELLVGTGLVVSGDIEATNGVVHVLDALQVPPAVATEIELNRIVELDPVQFSPGSSVILDESRAILEQAAEILVANPVGSVEIQGHTDTDGDEAVNLALSQQRAEAVLEFLVEAGVDPGRLSAVGYGETMPKVDPEETAADKAANRRIEFRLE